MRDRVLVLRSQDRSVTEIAEVLAGEGSPVSAQTVWAILKSEGIERLERRRPGGPAPRLEPVRAKAIGHWPSGARYDCDHAGLYLFLPAMAEFGLDTLVGAARYPATKVLSSFHSLASLLLLKCSRRGRAANAFPLGADPGLGLAAGLVALPKATPSHGVLLPGAALVQRGVAGGPGAACREVGLYGGEGGFTVDLTMAAQDLFGRYAERMVIENELDADICGFHLNALSSGLPLNVDVDTTLTVVAGNCYRLPRPRAAPLPARHPRPALAPLPRHHRQGRRQRRPRPRRPRPAHYTPVLIDAGYPELDIPSPGGAARPSVRLPAPPNLNRTIAPTVPRIEVAACLQIRQYGRVGWFGVRCLFEISEDTYEERVTIWEADDFGAALALAEEDAAEYAAPTGTYLGLAQAFMMFDAPAHGAEVFSLLRDSVLDADAYIERFFATGSERQGAAD